MAAASLKKSHWQAPSLCTVQLANVLQTAQNDLVEADSPGRAGIFSRSPSGALLSPFLGWEGSPRLQKKVGGPCSNLSTQEPSFAGEPRRTARFGPPLKQPFGSGLNRWQGLVVQKQWLLPSSGPLHSTHLGPPVVPFSPLFWRRVPLLKLTTEKSWYPNANLSTLSTQEPTHFF